MSLFSDVNNIVKPLRTASTPRTARTDARLDYVPHDPEHDKHQNRQERDEDALFGDDQTEVSLESLKAFFYMLLKEQGDDVEGGALPQAEPPHNKPMSKAEKAANAYEQASHYQEPHAEHQPKAHVHEEDAEMEQEPVQGALVLEPDQVRRIHQLQDKVDKLVARDIHTVHIRPAETFLESLERAVDEALEL